MVPKDDALSLWRPDLETCLTLCALLEDEAQGGGNALQPEDKG